MHGIIIITFTALLGKKQKIKFCPVKSKIRIVVLLVGGYTCDMTKQCFTLLSARDFSRIETAITFLCTTDGIPKLAQAAYAACLSPYHFQRLFKRAVGITPRQFAAAQRLDKIKERIAQDEAILSAALAVGLSGGGRAHDLFVSFDGATPGEFRLAGKGVNIRHGIAKTPFGAAAIAATARGVCSLRFATTSGEHQQILRQHWPEANLIADQSCAQDLVRQIFSPNRTNTPLEVRGTNFQINVWRALLAIPSGKIATYRALAQALGKPQAGRAVGNALAANPVAFLIPCHRVLRSNGALGGYAWGEARKRIMLAQEAN